HLVVRIESVRAAGNRVLHAAGRREGVLDGVALLPARAIGDEGVDPHALAGVDRVRSHARRRGRAGSSTTPAGPCGGCRGQRPRGQERPLAVLSHSVSFPPVSRRDLVALPPPRIEMPLQATYRTDSKEN